MVPGIQPTYFETSCARCSMRLCVCGFTKLRVQGAYHEKALKNSALCGTLTSLLHAQVHLNKSQPDSTRVCLIFLQGPTGGAF